MKAENHRVDHADQNKQPLFGGPTEQDLKHCSHLEGPECHGGVEFHPLVNRILSYKSFPTRDDAVGSLDS